MKLEKEIQFILAVDALKMCSAETTMQMIPAEKIQQNTAGKS